MLILTRRIGETLMIGDDVTVVSVSGQARAAETTDSPGVPGHTKASVAAPVDSADAAPAAAARGAASGRRKGLGGVSQTLSELYPHEHAYESSWA